MLVHNTQGNIDGAMIVVEDGDKVLKHKTVVLYPGWNEVKTELAGPFLNHPYVQKKLKAGLFIKHPKDSLDKCTPTEAQDIAANCADVRLLKIWVKNEKRAEVSYALQNQIDKILNPKKEG